MRNVLFALSMVISTTALANPPVGSLPYCQDIMATVRLQCVPSIPMEEYGADAINDCFSYHLTSYLESEQGDEIRANCEIDYHRPATLFHKARDPYRFRDKKKN